jgi:Holliday junction resolvase RusA-like endonuclease
MIAAKLLRRVTFVVRGIAQPKGSARAFVPRTWANEAVRRGVAPRAVITTDNPGGKLWERLVAVQAQRAARDGFFVGPVVVTITIRLPRPVSLKRAIRHHMTKPDLDKLVRAILDGLTGVLFDDDKQVVDLHARKCYADTGTAPSARITVETAARVEDLEQPDLLADVSLFERTVEHGEENPSTRPPRAGSETETRPGPNAEDSTRRTATSS